MNSDSRILRQQNAVWFSTRLIACEDVAVALDRDGIIVRSGTLNARILMRRLGLPGAVRAAFMFYNTEEECDRIGFTTSGEA